MGRQGKQSAEPEEEEMWAQCETCEKWRKLRPGTEVTDTEPW